MAELIPEKIRATSRGEIILAETLKGLPENYIVYHEPYIKNKRPDFVVIGPDLGVVVLEVKDYTKQAIIAANKTEWILQVNNNIVKHLCPLTQARKYAQELNDILKKDSQLILHDGPYKGSLRFPYGYGVVFTRLTQADMVQTDLYSIISPELCLNREEIDTGNELFSMESLLEKIQNMFAIKFNFREPLNEEEIRAIRYHLFPEVRISARQVEVPSPHYEEKILLSLRDIKVMDLYQENLAKGLGDNHRLIRGVAGSGKTMILACRAKYLGKLNPGWRILVLCYNISLANFIRQMIEEIEIETESRVEVYNFHNWGYKNWGLKDEGLIEELIARIKNGDVAAPRYDAILIDEGQDFEPAWLRLAYTTLNPETRSFLLVEDRAQQIYYRKALSQELGISFKGRSKVLTINYRNTEQIIKFAWDFYGQFSSETKTSHKDDIIEIILPRSTRRRGPEPVIKQFPNFHLEARSIAREIKRLHVKEEIAYSDIGILYRIKKLKLDYIQILKNALEKENIPTYWLSESNISKRNFQKRESTVKLSTVESAKGLEFKVVFICNLDNFPLFLEKEIQREVSLMYIGMTRATDRLYLTFSGKSTFTEYLLETLKNATGNSENKGTEVKPASGS